MPSTYTHSSPWLLEFVVFQLPECHLMLFTTCDELTAIEWREAHRQNLIHVTLTTNNNKSAFIIKYTIRKKTNTLICNPSIFSHQSKTGHTIQHPVITFYKVYAKIFPLTYPPVFSQKLSGARTFLSINEDRTLAEVIFFFRVQSHTVTVWYSLSSTDARYSPWLLWWKQTQNIALLEASREPIIGHTSVCSD